MAVTVLPSPEVPEALRARASRWADLKRWERRELGQELRRLGLSYREIAAIIPVEKGTLSGWCRDIELGSEQVIRLIERTRARSAHGRGARTNRRRRQEQVEAISRAALEEARDLVKSPLWTAGVMLYWGEGSKTRDLCFTNSDAEMVRLMMHWFRRFLRIENERFSIRMHLHSGQDEQEARQYWTDVAGVPSTQFGKTFWKTEGTGHRRNILYRGTVQVRICRSGDLFHRVMAWIEAWYPSRGPLAKLVIATDS